MMKYNGKLELTKEEKKWVDCVTCNPIIRKHFPDERIDKLILDTREVNERLVKREKTEEEKLCAYILEVAGTFE